MNDRRHFSTRAFGLFGASCLVLVLNLSYSQSDFKKGFIINSARDTVFGFLNYRESHKAYETCEFRTSENSTPVTYRPGEIFAYGFIKYKYFESQEIKSGNGNTELVFLQVIVRGLVTLYQHKDVFWVRKEGNLMYPLINEEKESYIDGRRIMRSSNQHIGTLNMFMSDCPSMAPHLRKVFLDEQTLVKLVERYNRCKGETFQIIKAEKPRVKAILGISAGLNISAINFRNAKGVYSHLDGSFEFSKTGIIGVNVNVLSPRLSERIAIHTGALFLASEYNKYSEVIYSSGTTRDYITIELQQLKIPFGLQYVFPERRFTPFVNAGIASTIHLSSSSLWIAEGESNNVVHTYRREALEIKGKQLGIWGGCGVLKSISRRLDAVAEIRYEHTNGIFPYGVDSEGLKSKVSNIQITVGLRTK